MCVRGPAIIVSYRGDAALVIYDDPRAEGRVIRPEGMKVPRGLCVDNTGHILCADYEAGCVHVISTAASGQCEVRHTLKTTDRFTPRDVAILGNHVFAADCLHHRVLEFGASHIQGAP